MHLDIETPNADAEVKRLEAIALAASSKTPVSSTAATG
jgi:hypothetical protein